MTSKTLRGLARSAVIAVRCRDMNSSECAWKVGGNRRKRGNPASFYSYQQAAEERDLLSTLTRFIVYRQLRI